MSESLASLDLGYNELSALPLDALRPLRALNWLNLQKLVAPDNDSAVLLGR
jgi:hypothetical protein